MPAAHDKCYYRALSPQFDKTKPTVGHSSDQQLIALWLHGRSPHTERAYKADVLRLQRFTGTSLHEVTLGDLQRFADSLGSLAAGSRYRILSSVKSVLAFGYSVGYLPFDVGRLLRLPSLRSRLAERILTAGEFQRMLALEPDPGNKLILLLLYASGIRRGELAALRWRDIQPSADAGHVTVQGKGGKTRAILLPVSVWQQLTSTRGLPDDRVIPLSDSAIWRIVRRAALRAGLQNVSPHWLRHAHASHALDGGAPIHLVQATLGHATIATTGRYLHARPQDSSGRFLGL